MLRFELHRTLFENESKVTRKIIENGKEKDPDGVAKRKNPCLGRGPTSLVMRGSVSEEPGEGRFREEDPVRLLRGVLSWGISKGVGYRRPTYPLRF
jgi:hypothetical protein